MHTLSVVRLSVTMEPSPEDAHSFVPSSTIDTSCIWNLHGGNGFITGLFLTYPKQGTNMVCLYLVLGVVFFAMFLWHWLLIPYSHLSQLKITLFQCWNSVFFLRLFLPWLEGKFYLLHFGFGGIKCHGNECGFTEANLDWHVLHSCPPASSNSLDTFCQHCHFLAALVGDGADSLG